MHSNLRGVQRSPGTRREEQLFSAVPLLQRRVPRSIIAIAEDMPSKLEFDFSVLRELNVEGLALRAFVQSVGLSDQA